MKYIYILMGFVDYESTTVLGCWDSLLTALNAKEKWKNMKSEEFKDNYKPYYDEVEVIKVEINKEIFKEKERIYL